MLKSPSFWSAPKQAGCLPIWELLPGLYPAKAAAVDVFGASLYEPCGQIDQIGNIFGATATNRDTRGCHDKIRELALQAEGASIQKGLLIIKSLGKERPIMYDNPYCIDKGCDPLEYINNEQQYSQNESVCPLDDLKCPKSKDLPQECSVLCM